MRIGKRPSKHYAHQQRRKRSSGAVIAGQQIYHQPQLGNKVPVYPLIAGILGVIFISLLFFTQINPSPTAYVVAEQNDKVYCIKESRDGFNYPAFDKNECCFLLENTDRCVGPLQNTQAEYRLIYSDDIETYEHEYGCYGGSSKRVLFTSLIKNYCGLQI